MTHASESGHWYERDGTPRYTCIINGKEKPTTLRQAKTRTLLPSVTTVMQLLAKPGLAWWKEGQLLETAWTFGPEDADSFQEYQRKVRGETSKKLAEAPNKGTKVHFILETYGKAPYNVQEQYYEKCQEVYEYLYQLTQVAADEWTHETSFGCPEGYAGKTDIWKPERLNHPHQRGVVVDFKTTSKCVETTPISYLAYDDHGMQLAAYGKGLGLHKPRMINLYIDVNVFLEGDNAPMCKHREWSDDEGEDLLERFLLVLELWKRMKGYDPSWEEAA